MTIVSIDEVGDGEHYSEDIHRIFGGKEDREEAFYASYVKNVEVRHDFIRDYVRLNGLNVTAFQDTGYDPVPLLEEGQIDYVVQYPDIAGEWTDRISQRAHLTLKDSAYPGVYDGEIIWGDSASSWGKWKFSAWYAPEVNRLVYINCVCANEIQDSTGRVTEIRKYSNGSGSIGLREDNSLYWMDEYGATPAACEFVRK